MNPTHLRTLAALAGPDKRSEEGRRSLWIEGDGDVLTATVTTANGTRVSLECPQFEIVKPRSVDARHLSRAIAAARNDVEITGTDAARLSLSTLLPRAVPWSASVVSFPDSAPPKVTPDPDTGRSCRLAADDVAALEWVASIAPLPPHRYGISVVQCDEAPDGSRVWVATDGNRMHVAPAPSDAPVTPAKAAGKLSAEFARLACRLMPRGFTLHTTPGHVVAANGVWRLQAVRVVADFPDWRAVLPASTPERATVEADKLRAPMPAFIRITKDNPNAAVPLTLIAGAFRCRVKVPDVGESEAMVPLVSPPTSWTVRGLRARFLLDALRDAADAVTVEATGRWDDPVLLHRVDRRMAVLMPVRMDGQA